MKILHINSTKRGGGVAELLQSQIRLERLSGIKSHWCVLEINNSIAKVTKKMHNLLQGKECGSLTALEKQIYLQILKNNEKKILKTFNNFKPDIVVIHDPQPLPLIKIIPKNTTVILRMHIDLSKPHTNTLKFIKPQIEKCDMVILTSLAYKPPWLPKNKVRIVMPAIDSLTQKNKPILGIQAKEILSRFGINIDKPIVSQISRFDPWKDPIGVINAYYIAKYKIPDLQLILAGIMEAADDPEAKEIFEKVKKHASGDPDIFLFADIKSLRNITNALFINAVQTASDVILQKSIREGFGLTVTEAMWKGKAVIGGVAEGIKLQIKNGKNGFLVSSHKQAAKIMIRLLKNPSLRARIGLAAHKSVEKKFLMPRLIADHIKIYRDCFSI